MSRLSKVVVPALAGQSKGTVFFFHGSGSSANETKDGVAYLLRKNFSYPHLKVIFPNAPLQPYTPLDGELSNVWFDRIAIDSSVPEKLESLDSIGEEIKKLIEEENKQGTPNSKIIVGGISMGGALALHTALRWKTSLAGVFAISSFLNDGSAVYKHLETISHPVPELIQFHGAQDDLVPLESAKNSFDRLTSLRVNGNFFIDEYADHAPCKEQLSKLYNWIAQKLPNT